MSVKTVTLADDAYDALAARKKPGESFSDVVRRLTRSDRSLMEFAGGWSHVPAAEFAKFEAWLSAEDRTSKAKMMRLARRRAR